MTKATDKASKASKAGASTTGAQNEAASRASTAETTTSRASGHVVAPGHRVSVKGTFRTAGASVTAAELATKRDPEGKAGLQRLVDGGELVRGGKATDDRAGGGLMEQGGGTGAGPSAAQIAAADAGDEGSARVVDAALSGTEADFTKAADPDAKA